MTHKPLCDKEKMIDSLSTHKHVTSGYNTNVIESATPEVRSSLMQILKDEHEICYNLWNEMNSRGWYPVEKADDNKLSTTKTKHQNVSMQN